MTFTYNITDPDDEIAYIRLKLGDRDAAAPIFTDEEIARMITLEGDKDQALHALESVQLRELAKEPNSVRIGDAQIEQDVGAQLKAMEASGKDKPTARVSVVQRQRSDI